MKKKHGQNIGSSGLQTTKTVVHKRLEANKANPTIAQAHCLDRISRSWHK